MNDGLISRSALKKVITDATYNFEQIPIRVDKVQEIIDNAPTVDAPTYTDIIEANKEGYNTARRLYERPRGEWVQISPAKIYECSICHQVVMTSDIDCYSYCHNCGARMEEENDNT